MEFKRGFESGQGSVIKTKEKFLGRRRGKNFIKEDFQRGMRNRFQSQRRLAHFADASTQEGGVLGTEVGVQTEGHLEFVNRLRGDSGGKDLMQTPEGIVVALEARDALLHGQAAARHFFKRA